MSGPLRSLLVGWGITVDGQDKLDRVEGSLDSIATKLKRVASGLASVFVIKQIAGFITDQIEAGAALDRTAEKLGLSVDELERYRYATAQNGVEQQAAERALMMFNRQLGEAEIGTKAAVKGIGELGGGFTAAQLSAMPLQDLLGHLADKFQATTDKGLKTQLAMKLFGRQGSVLIPMLDQGADGMKRWNEEFDALGGGIGGTLANKLKEQEQGLKRLAFVWNVLKARIVGGVLPAVEKAVLWFTRITTGLEWLEKHSYMAQTALLYLSAAAAVALAPFLASLLPIVAGMTALYILFDDFYTMMMGGKSVIGDFIDSLYGKGAHETFVKDVKEQFAAFITWVRDVAIPFCKDLGASLKWAFVNALPGIRMLADAAQALWTSLKGVTEAIGALSAGNGRGAWDILGKAGDKAKELITGGKSDEWLNYEAKLRAWKATQDQSGEAAAAASGQPFYVPRPATLPAPSPVQVPQDPREESDKFWSDARKGADLGESGATVSIDKIEVNVTAPSGSDPAAHGKAMGDAAEDAVKRAVSASINKLPWAPGMPIPSPSPGGG